jgi:ABC-type transport system substrate-binding protein
MDAEPSGQGPPAREISRRRFLVAMTKGIAGIGTTGSLLAACSDGGASTTATPAATSFTTTTTTTAATSTTAVTSSTAATSASELRIDILADPTPDVDPLNWSAQSIQRVYRLTNESLLTWDDTRQIVPQLATGLPEVGEDGLTYTVTLREGVTFHNGKPFTSEDVRFSFETIGAEESTSQWKPRVSMISAIETPDDRTVVFTLASVFTPFLGTLARIPIVPSNVPYTVGDTYARQTIGTGPYRFVEWIQGDQIVLGRFERYWEEGLPVTQLVVMKVVPEDGVRTANAVAGTTHIVPDPSLSQLHLLSDGGVTVTIADDSTNRVFMYPNLDPARFTGASYAARRAIAEAIGRDGIANEAFFGTAIPASTLLSSGADHFDPQLGDFFGGPADPEEAAQYLEEAGGPPQEPLGLYLINDPYLLDTAVMVQADLAAVGIPVAIFVESTSQVVERLTVTREYDLVLLAVEVQAASGFGSEYPYFAATSDMPGNLNGSLYGFPADTEYDALLLAAVQAPEEEAGAAWQAVQRYDAEQGLYEIQIVTARYVEAIADSVSGYQASSLGGPYNVKHAAVARS